MQPPNLKVRPPWSAEARVLFCSASAYRQRPRDGNGFALLLRKPLLLAFLLGCAVSILASGRFSVLIADGIVSFAFVPAIEMAAFALVYKTGARRGISFARAVDCFFIGNAPWLLWIVVVIILGSVVPPRRIGRWLLLTVLAASLIPVAWSAYIDFHFFRKVMNRTAGGAVRDLVVHRAIGWVGATAYFFGIAIWSEMLPELAAWVGL